MLSLLPVLNVFRCPSLPADTTRTPAHGLPSRAALDDALAAVNPSLEMEILGRIRRHAPETAVLCITRRPALGNGCDQPFGNLELAPLAWRRAGIAEIVLPKENEPALEALPQEVRKRLVFHPIQSLDEVLAVELVSPEAKAVRELLGTGRRSGATSGSAATT